MSMDSMGTSTKAEWTLAEPWPWSHPEVGFPHHLSAVPVIEAPLLWSHDIYHIIHTDIMASFLPSTLDRYLIWQDAAHLSLRSASIPS